MNHYPPSSPRGAWAFAAAWLALASPVFAQTSAKDQALLLPEFNVIAASAADAYTVTDTTSGSRTDTATKDLPYSISSLTDKFFQDFAVIDLTDELSYISGITGNTDSLTFSVRGFTGGNNVLYNGHFRYTTLVAGQVARVELIKGPSGSIYGQTNPGGTVFVTTYQPTATQQESLNVVVGSYETESGVLHVSGPVPVVGGDQPKLFYNVDVTDLHRLFDNPGIHREEKSVSGTLLFKPDDKTSVSVTESWQQFRIPVAGDWAIPYTVRTGANPYTGASMTYYDGFAYWLRHANYASSADFVLRQSTAFSATLQRRLTDWLSFQTGYDWYHTPAETYTTLGSGGTVNEATGLIGASATPSWSTIYGTGWSYSADLLAHYAVGKIDNQSLITVDDYLNNRTNYSKTTIAGTFTPGITSFNPLLPVTSAVDPRDDAHWTSSTTLNDAVESEGFSFNQQSALFDKRLLLYAGYRHDYVTGYNTNPSSNGILTSTATATVVSLSGNARQDFIHDSNDSLHGGVSVEITRQLNWYAGVYEGFSPFGTGQGVTVSIPTGSSAFVTQQLLKTLSPASTTSLGGETGITGDFLNHAISFGADVFDTKQKNVGVTELSDPTNPNSATVTVNEGDQTAKGAEGDMEFKILEGLHGMLSYSYVDAKVENQGVNVLATGHRPRGTPYDSASAALNYAVFRGFSTNLGVIYKGNTPALSPSTGLIKNPATGLFDRTDGRMNIRTPAYAVFTLGAGYQWKLAKWSNRVSVNVKNLFNRLSIAPGNATAYIGDERGVYFSYHLSH